MRDNECCACVCLHVSAKQRSVSSFVGLFAYMERINRVVNTATSCGTYQQSIIGMIQRILLAAADAEASGAVLLLCPSGFYLRLVVQHGAKDSRFLP